VNNLDRFLRQKNTRTNDCRQTVYHRLSEVAILNRLAGSAWLRYVLEVNRLLKKWAFLSAVAALVVIGCGGSSGGGHTTTTGTGTTAGTGGIPGTNIQIGIGGADNTGTSYSYADFLYLTGQGRAQGDLTADIKRITVGDLYGLVDGSVNLSLPLSSFTSQLGTIDVPFKSTDGSGSAGSRLFENFQLSINDFLVEGADPTSHTTATAPTDSTYPARIRVFPGRHTSIPILLDDSMFTLSGDSSTVSLNASNFTNRNYDSTGRITSFLSDYVQFDISQVTAPLPLLLADNYGGPVKAGRLFVSGDNFAIGVDNSAGSGRGRFQVLTTDSGVPLFGYYGPPSTLGGRNTPGTYDLKQDNPVIGQISRITSLQGIWRDYTTVMSGFGPFEVVVFPNVQDGTTAEMVAVVKNGNTITNIYFGTVDYNAGRFQLFPINQIVSAGVAGELDGSVSGFKTADGSKTNVGDAIRYGVYTFDKAPTVSGFQQQGTFIVFRK
jgi:hypothetical protein